MTGAVPAALRGGALDLAGNVYVITGDAIVVDQRTTVGSSHLMCVLSAAAGREPGSFLLALGDMRQADGLGDPAAPSSPCAFVSVSGADPANLTVVLALPFVGGGGDMSCPGPDSPRAVVLSGWATATSPAPDALWSSLSIAMQPGAFLGRWSVTGGRMCDD